MKVVTRNFPFRTTLPPVSLGASSEMLFTFTMRRRCASESKKVTISWKFPVTTIWMGTRA